MTKSVPCYVCGVLVIVTDVRMDPQMEARIRAGEDITNVKIVGLCDDCYRRYEEWRKSRES